MRALLACKCLEEVERVAAAVGCGREARADQDQRRGQGRISCGEMECLQFKYQLGQSAGLSVDKLVEVESMR